MRPIDRRSVLAAAAAAALLPAVTPLRAGAANTPAMDALRAMMPPSQILFGTDYPFVPPAQTISQLAGLGLPADVVSAIGQNAAALFPRYRS